MNSGYVDVPDVIQLYSTECYPRGGGIQQMSQNVFQNHSLHTNIWKFSADNFSYNLFPNIARKWVLWRK